jgi:Transposase DDE domain
LAEALVLGGKGGAQLERIAGLPDWAALDAVLGGLRAALTGPAGLLVIGDEAAVYADKGYVRAARQAGLAGSGGGITRRSNRNRPLTPEETARTRALAPIRAAVKRVFGTLKRSYGWARMRYRGLPATPPTSTSSAPRRTSAAPAPSPPVGRQTAAPIPRTRPAPPPTEPQCNRPRPIHPAGGRRPSLEPRHWPINQPSAEVSQRVRMP